MPSSYSSRSRSARARAAPTRILHPPNGATSAPPTPNGAGPGGAPASTSAPPAPAPPPAPAAPGAIAAPTRRTRGKPALLIGFILLVVGAVGLTLGYRYWYESVHFVITDNAQVTGDLVQVGSLTAGRLVATRVEVGDRVERDQVIALVAVPQQVGEVPFTTTPLLEDTGSLNTQVAVRAPFGGLVAARSGSVGGTVTAGQAIYALVDPRRIWINANVEEAKVGRVRAGQPVEVHVDALDQTFPGRVTAITPASAATFSLLPAQNASGNFTKVTQYVPVRIAVDSGDTVLPLGTSVQVRIQVQ